jgi:hypothetical protein
MRSRYDNLYSLQEWIQFLGHFNPWFVSQFYWKQESTFDPIQPYKRPTESCDLPWFEDIYTNAILGRQDCNRAIYQAERLFERHIGYSPAPRYYVREEYEYNKLHANVTNFIPTQRNVNYGDFCDAPNGKKAIKLRQGYLQQVGVENLELIGEYDVTRTDLIPDGLKDNFSGTVPIADAPVGTTENELAFFFTEADRYGKPLDEWEIRHVFTDVNGANFTFKGDAYLLVKPLEVLRHKPLGLDAANDDNYVTKVAVYRRTTDTTDQGVAVWSNDCSNPAKNICFSTNFARDGYLIPDKVEICDEEENCEWVSFDSYVRCNGYPDRILANYLAGYPRETDGRVDQEHAEIITYLSAALLSCKDCDCGCGHSGHTLAWYAEPFVYETQLLAFPQSREVINEASRFGMTNGGVMAWNLAVTLDMRNIGIAF